MTVEKRCEIIAEIGQNHNGDMSLAKELIHAAAENGADVAKFQLFDAQELFPSSEEGNEWFEYNCSTELSKDDLYMLVEECERHNIEFMSSAFDVSRVKWLEEVNVKRHKLASRSINDKRLLNEMLKSGKTVISSLGLWKGDSFPQIEPPEQVEFLYCVSKYPTQLSELNLKHVSFHGPQSYSGFSDHTVGLSAPITAMARGAKIIEKHFTLDCKMIGPDHKGSMEPGSLGQLSNFRDEITRCLGDVEQGEGVLSAQEASFVI